MFTVTNTTRESSHITFSTNCASDGYTRLKCSAWVSTRFLRKPSVSPGAGKNRRRTAASSLRGAPLLNSFVLWQSVHSLSPGVYTRGSSNCSKRLKTSWLYPGCDPDGGGFSPTPVHGWLPE